MLVEQKNMDSKESKKSKRPSLNSIPVPITTTLSMQLSSSFSIKIIDTRDNIKLDSKNEILHKSTINNKKNLYSNYLIPKDIKDKILCKIVEDAVRFF